LLSGLVAIPLVYAALPLLNAFSGKQLSMNLAGDPVMWGILFGVPLIVGLLSGMYPALFLSAFDPATVLKGTFLSRGVNAAVWLRKGLVSMQFVISIVLIACTIVAFRQLDYLRNKNLGFNKDQVLLVPMQLTPFWQHYAAFRSEARQYPNIVDVTVVEDVPGSKYQTNSYQPEGLTESVQYPRLEVHDDFAKVFGMQLAAGRGYSQEHPADSANSIIINEAMVRQLGWGTPAEALGRRIEGGGPPQAPPFRTVVGVLKDFNYASLRQPIGPFIVERYRGPGDFSFFGRYLAVRITPNDVEGTIAFLENQWNRYVQTRSFEYFFLDAELDALYKSEATLGKVATTFSILAILVACLGLFGMASFSAERRTKEIGVRKVMGASAGRIVLLLSSESVKLVGLAFLLAGPIAYIAVTKWLETFSYHTQPGLWPFAAAGALVLAISWLTVGAQSMKAAGVDPVVSLRYE
ncbi:MAG: FtsX-like permease family protein, partial [Rhodothermales bacterium]